MGLLRVRNCTIWDVHYWRELHGGDDSVFAAPGEEGTLSCDVSFTLGVKRLHQKKDGKDYRKSVNKNGIYYVVWDAGKNKLQILSEKEANTYPVSPDNHNLTRWINKLPNWMHRLNGNYTLDRYTIPGTHDSGTSKIPPGPSHTQNFGILTQLKYGIRFLDIRLDGVTVLESNLVVKHGCDLCYLNFSDVLDDCKSFLTANSSETILMLVNKSHCISTNIADKFEGYLKRKEYEGLFYLSDQMPKLDEVRGKIVLLRRFELSGQQVMGIDVSAKWESDAIFTLTNRQKQHFVIEDLYHEHDTHKKVVIVKSNLDNARKNPTDGCFYITFNSIATGGHSPYQYAWGGHGVDPAMNPKLEEYLRNHPGGNRFGVVVMDYYNNHGSQNENVEMLIDANYDLLR